jgi:NADPH:quinone reductase-like Zn-dependent oxidoreductase
MASTRGLQFEAAGDPGEVLSLTDLDLPSPDAGQVTVVMEAAPVDPSDLGFVRGRYGLRPVLPSGAGQSGVGRISATGPGTMAHSVGDRVLIIPTGQQFTWRERVNVDVANIVTVDPDADPVQLSTVGINQMTAYQLLNYTDAKDGAWVAQTAANSAVASSVIALARRRGLRTLNIVRRPEAVALVDDRADAVLVNDDDLAGNIESVLAGETVPLLLAATGSAVATVMKSLSYKGVVVSYGALDGQPITLPNIVFGNISVHGFWVLNWIRDTGRHEVLDAYRRVAQLVTDGTLVTPVEATYSLADFAAASAHAARTGADGRQGKVFFTFPRH